MRLEPGRHRAECRLIVNAIEHELLLQSVKAGEEPQLPDDVMQHLVDHGHFGGTTHFPGDRQSTFLGMPVYVE